MINTGHLKSIYLLVFVLGCDSTSDMKREITPPSAEKIPYELTLHGDVRIDNYYWMRLSDEQKNSSVPDEQTQKVLDYLNAENAYKEACLADTKNTRDILYDEMIGRIKKDDSSVPYFKNGYWYYSRYEEGNEYPIYCRKKDNLESREEILLNVNTMAKGYDYYNVRGLNVSPDNKVLAYGVDTLSRRVYTLYFKDLQTGEILSDEAIQTTGSYAWANDSKTIFYTRKNEITLLSEKVLRHTLGKTTDDVEVYREDDPSYYIGVRKSKSGKYIIIWNNSTLSTDYHILPADQPASAFTRFSPREEVHEYEIEHYKNRFYVLTNWNAKNFRLMSTPENKTDKSNWQEVIPHREDVLLEDMEVFSDFLVLSERKDGLTELRVIDQNSGDEHYLDFGEPAYMSYISVNPEMDSRILRYVYSSLTTPLSTYDYDMEDRTRVLMKQEQVVGGHDPDDYKTERLSATARDGQKVPISLVYKKGFIKNGEGPLLLYGYGSYGSTIDPSFSSSLLSLLDRGFAYAIAHVRGSQTLGREWYEAGKMFHKKNTFYDFIDCARYLIDNNYTGPHHLYARGGSAGGLLMGSVVNLAPELFHGVIAAVPFVDVVTTMSDPSIPLTTNEYDEWGNPAASIEEYEYILSYSPYDNVLAQDYPNMLVTTGLYDSQVQYWEPAKWVAKLREFKTDDNLLLLHTNMDAGHGGVSGRYRRYRDIALQYAFILDMEGINN